MDIKNSNVCTRCGEPRIDSKSWKEKTTNFMGTITVFHTETVCPDPECQKIVQKQLDMLRKRKEEFERDKEERIRLKKENRIKAA